MKVRLKFLPGQMGAKKLTAKYGNNLVCVRYRYDEKQRKRFTTVELIVDEIPWTKSHKNAQNAFLKIKKTESKLQDQIKKAGGSWDPVKFLWTLPHSKIKQLGLENRITTEKEMKQQSK